MNTEVKDRLQSQIIIVLVLVFIFSSRVISQTNNSDCIQFISGKTLDLSTESILASMEVQLHDDQGNLLSTVVSDDEGNFQFEISCQSKYKVLVDFSIPRFDSVTSFESDAVIIVGSDKNNFSFNTNLFILQTTVSFYREESAFPWKPPQPSELSVIPDSVFSNCKTFKDVNEVLSSALDANGYVDKSYFEFDPIDNISGFILATKLERINKKGYAYEGDDRWNKNVRTHDFSFSDYISALFFTRTGYYRIIVFVITDVNFETDKNYEANREEASNWVINGMFRLSQYLEEVPFTENYKVTALIYQYSLKENAENAVLVKNSGLTGKDHLIRSKIWKSLVQD